MYTRILQSIQNLGFGLETTGKATIHIPMAYGTIAMAAALHGDEQTARAAADWLCSNSTSTHKTGWRLNWAWVAFANGVINPADTLYGVTIAIAVDGLYRTYQLTGDQRYLDTVVKALHDYAEQHSQQADDAIYFHYSDQAADHGYRVANITAMLMAQYATLGAATHHSEWIALADHAYRGLMADALHTEAAVSWHYLGNAPKPRDNDPGVRTFATFYADVVVGHLGEGDFSRIQRLAHYLDDLISRLSKEKNKQRQRRMRMAAARMRDKIKHLIDELHHKVAHFLVKNFDCILLPTFETSQMAAKAKRKIRSKTVRNLLTFAHYRFKQFLKHKAQEYGKIVLDVCEAYTSKTHPETGVLHKIDSAKRIRLTNGQ
ncbi:transposase, IS605 OrfB family [Thiorhodovibrio winogradskyi]|uniref:Transposase, IS605 OrfB family n=1 Tax=Thiorhodovibrio winogradskyi TaxID=77007 RepID=A0ABZ0S1Z7_9GAMM|nr:zinc ribbon domain-containing protein [Thiorhodovibrio winogradskyi]